MVRDRVKTTIRWKSCLSHATTSIHLTDMWIGPCLALALVILLSRKNTLAICNWRCSTMTKNSIRQDTVMMPSIELQNFSLNSCATICQQFTICFYNSMNLRMTVTFCLLVSFPNKNSHTWTLKVTWLWAHGPITRQSKIRLRGTSLLLSLFSVRQTR